jgi:hypothetical protein
MAYAGTYVGTVREYCAEFDYKADVTVSIDENNNVTAASTLLGTLQGGTIDSSGHISGLVAPINSLSLGHISLPYSGSDNGLVIDLQGTAANGVIGSIEANLVPKPLDPVTTIEGEDGTHFITGAADGLTLHSIGQDVMTGGGVRETFAFTPGFGRDEISDFVVGGPDHDTIDLSATRYRSLAGLLSHTTMGDDGSATIHLNPHDAITIDGVSKAQLKAHPQDVAFG